MWYNKIKPEIKTSARKRALSRAEHPDRGFGFEVELGLRLCRDLTLKLCPCHIYNTFTNCGISYRWYYRPGHKHECLFHSPVYVYVYVCMCICIYVYIYIYIYIERERYSIISVCIISISISMCCVLVCTQLPGVHEHRRWSRSMYMSVYVIYIYIYIYV